MTEFAPGLEQTFRAHKHELQQRVGTIEAAVAAIGCGELDAALRTRAEHDAHTLAGSLATFGLLRGSELAHELGDKFASGLPELSLDVGPLSACVITLRTEIDAAYARLEGLAPSEPRDAPLLGSEAAGEPVVPPERSVLEADARRQLRGEMLENGLSRTEPAEFTSGRILVVDDDAAVRDAIVAILCDAGYDANGVGSAREARYELANNTIPLLLLSDVSMPGETGLDLIRFALCEHPETATLLISGWDDPGIAVGHRDPAGGQDRRRRRRLRRAHVGWHVGPGLVAGRERRVDDARARQALRPGGDRRLPLVDGRDPLHSVADDPLGRSTGIQLSPDSGPHRMSARLITSFGNSRRVRLVR